ncbi:MAG TPA: glycosyltransferase family 4 protein [bacterium]|nr:glycosyltransferase family 4 protein [bacterium]
MVQAEFPSMAFFDVPSNATKILDCHNVEYDNYRRMSELEWSGIRRFFYQREYTRFYDEEIEVCRKQDALFVTCRRDKEILDTDTAEVPKYIIPNGVDLEYFRPPTIQPEPYSLVFTGMMGYVPNYDAMVYFLDEVFPILQKQVPGIHIYIVGNNPPDILARRESDQVTITGFVEDVRPFIARAAVYVVPLRMGGGTRLKVLEALSMQKPVVTTALGCEGIDVLHEETALITDEPEAFADAIIRLLKDQQLQQRLTRNGYQLVREQYDWRIIGELIERSYQDITSATIPRTSRQPEQLTEQI